MILRVVVAFAVWLSVPAMTRSAPPVSSTAALPPYIVLNTSGGTMAATYQSPAGVDPGGIRFVVDGVDKTKDAVVTEDRLTYRLPEQPTFAAHSVRLEVRDRAGVLGTAAVSATEFDKDAPPNDGANHTSVSYNLLRREQVCVHVCHWGTETPTRVLELTQGPGLSTADWDGREEPAGDMGLPDLYTFYVYVRRDRHWVRIAAVDPVRLAARLRPAILSTASKSFQAPMLPKNQECRDALLKPIPQGAQDWRLSYTYAPSRFGQGDFGDPQLALNGRPLVTLRASSVMVNANWRATQTRNRLLRLAHTKVPPSQVTVAYRGGFWKILAGDVAVELLTEEDARHAGKSPEALAQDWREATQTILRFLESPRSKKP